MVFALLVFFLFPCIFELILLVYVENKIILNYWISCVSFFQTIGLCVSPHITYCTQITIGRFTSIVNWSHDGYWKGFCAIPNALNLHVSLLIYFLYSS